MQPVSLEPPLRQHLPSPDSSKPGRDPIDRKQLVERYRRNRERSARLFDLLNDEDAHYFQPIPLRHPFVFYEGHVPAFSFNTLVKKALGGAGIDDALETLFARGIDPPSDAPLGSATASPESPGAPGASTSGALEREAARNRALWPDGRVVRQFAQEADERVMEALAHAEIERPGHPLLERAEAVFVILEHEVMHQETLLYMLHRMPYARKTSPAGCGPRLGAAPPARWIEIGPGLARLGIDRFDAPYAWDNEAPRHAMQTPAFSIQSIDVTNAAFMEFVEAGGYREPRFWRPEDWAWVRREGIGHPAFWERRNGGWLWRGLFEAIPLPAGWPVYVTHAEAEAYARWRRVRLPTEAEFQRAAYGTPGDDARPAAETATAAETVISGGRARDARPFPWGEATPVGGRHGVFDFCSWDPQPAGSHPQGCSAWGVDDLVGNGWEWTSTLFAPFPGFRPQATYPEYSADFFDGDHFVLKGASPATAGELLRPTFRNWFRGRYPYMYATFRCAKDRA